MAKKRTSIFKKPDLSDNLEAIERLKKKRHWDGDTIGRLWITYKMLLHHPSDTEPVDDENQTYSTALADSIPEDLLIHRIKLANDDELKTASKWDDIHNQFTHEFRECELVSLQGTSALTTLINLMEPIRLEETAAPYIDGQPEPLKTVYDDTFMLSVFNADKPLDMTSLENLVQNIWVVIDACVHINGYNNTVDATKEVYQIPLFDRFKYTEQFLQNMLATYNDLLDKTELAIKGNTKNDPETMDFKLAIFHTIFKPIDMSQYYIMSKNDLIEELSNIVDELDTKIFDGGAHVARNLTIGANDWILGDAQTIPEDILDIWLKYKKHKS